MTCLPKKQNGAREQLGRRSGPERSARSCRDLESGVSLPRCTFGGVFSRRDLCRNPLRVRTAFSHEPCVSSRSRTRTSRPSVFSRGRNRRFDKKKSLTVHLTKSGFYTEESERVEIFYGEFILRCSFYLSTTLLPTTKTLTSPLRSELVVAFRLV